MSLEHFSLKRAIDGLAVLVKNAVGARLIRSFSLGSCIEADAEQQRQHEVDRAKLQLDCNRVEGRPDQKIDQPGTVSQPRARRGRGRRVNDVAVR